MPTLRSQTTSRPVTRQNRKVTNPRSPGKKKTKQQDNKTQPTTRRTRNEKAREILTPGPTNEVQARETETDLTPENQTVECEEPQVSEATSSGECQLIDNSRPDLVLGQLDAHFTKMFLDIGMKSSHKYCAPPKDFFALIQNPKVKPLSEQLMQSYASSFEYVKYHEIDGYFSYEKELCVKARKNLPKKWTITGLDGYLADVPCGVQIPEFSLFGSNGKGKEKIMLGPASFVNHACKPNAQFICGGETRGKTIVRIETLRHINANEEIFVKYSEDYFGPNNVDCRCSTCIQELLAPLHQSQDPTEPDELDGEPEGYTIPQTSEIAFDARISIQPGSPALFEAPDELDGEPEGYIIPHPSEIGRPQPQARKSKKIKYDEVTECLICEVKCKRMDKHLLYSHPELTKEEVRTIKDFLRTRRAHANKHIYYCEEHLRTFADKRSHKRYFSCSLDRVHEVSNHQSKKCLPMSLRLKLKNSVVANEEHLRLAEQHLIHTYSLKNRACGLEADMNAVKGKQALKTVLAVLFGNTLALTKPKVLTNAVNR